MCSQDAQITKQYLRHHNHLVLCGGVLYRLMPPSRKDQNTLQLVIPQNYQHKALQGCHDDNRHMGFEQMLDPPRIQNFTLQSMSNAFGSKVNHKGQKWRIFKLPTTTASASRLSYQLK